MPEAIDVFGHQFTGYAVHAFVFGFGFCAAVVIAGCVTIADLVAMEFRHGSGSLSDRRRERGDDGSYGDPTKAGDE